ncbi:MAG: metal-dependent hydrolase [Alphaproteobacteria bacterium]
MILAHIPAGYLLTTGILSRFGGQPRRVLAIGLLASVLPDFDLAWFYLIDGRHPAHHTYPTHTPAFWILFAFGCWIACRLARLEGSGFVISVALANLLLHLALDSIAGNIRWLWPIKNAGLNFIDVPAKYDWWVWSFLLHWTILFEIAIAGAALVVWSRPPAK